MNNLFKVNPLNAYHEGINLEEYVLSYNNF